MLVLWDLSSLDDIRAFPHEARMSPTIRRFVAADVLPVNYTRRSDHSAGESRCRGPGLMALTYDNQCRSAIAAACVHTQLS